MEHRLQDTSRIHFRPPKRGPKLDADAFRERFQPLFNFTSTTPAAEWHREHDTKKQDEMNRNKNGARRGAGILSALQATEMIDTRSRLPAEIMVAILDYLPIGDQMRVAQSCRRLQEMVYDDTRWVSRLKAMGCWDEREARRRFEESIRRRREREAAERAAAAQSHGAGGGDKQAVAATLFDASTEQEKRRRALSDLRDGFETMAVGSPANANANNNANVNTNINTNTNTNTNANASANADAGGDTYLDVFNHVKSVRGGARQEYGKVYSALAPFYLDVMKAKSHADPIIFKAFRDPEKQARMLANLKKFAKSDWSLGCIDRAQRLASMTTIFETAVLREFEQAFELWDVDGRMRRYGHVLHTLNGARAGADHFIQNHPIFDDRDLAFSPAECFRGGTGNPDDISLEPSRRFLEGLLAKLNEQAAIVQRVFPEPATVFWGLTTKVTEDIIVELTTSLFDECHRRSTGAYLKAVSGVFEQTSRFFRSLTPPMESKKEVAERATELSLRIFEPHLDLYLQDELEFFTKLAEMEVSQWERKLSDEDSTLESYFMANINRSAEKKDFLSSFKKVVMMPVTLGSSFATTKPSTLAPSTAYGSRAATPLPSRPETPTMGGRASPMMSGKAPTDELAAKAALMASKLEGIKSLCSIEVALSLVHMAKTSLGRAAVLIPLGGQVGGEAREQCANMFVVLLRILGLRHVKPGFDTAVDHLSHYNPREVSDHNQQGVAPLVTFIELVNVGDLISQMIDVFYEQQLVTPKIADKNDFLDPAGLAKKKFEQMLDESVAAGLNKGIDVLMDEVEYLHSTTQQPTDYNPAPDTGGKAGSKVASMSASEPDIGPTPTARRIVELVSAHTNMLVGTTDKAMLDVFNAEVGQRLFAAICKHLKRQRISTVGSIKLIADMNHYADYARSLRNQDLIAYFAALRELSQIYLIDASHARDMAAVIADGDRFGGVFRAEEVYDYAQRRADWYAVKKGVERAMYGMECIAM
ncbi:hypothetical protein RJ55_07008 [Drechmeria coniospora]|nr:hypothetical protein RJ55_07008 [Drechmeria coniospora]